MNCVTCKYGKEIDARPARQSVGIDVQGNLLVEAKFLCHSLLGLPVAWEAVQKLTSHEHQDNRKDFFVICIGGDIPKPDGDQTGETKVERCAVATLKPT